jgi:hypothetical protein
MRRRVWRILLLLWLAWYAWGPVDQLADFWDTPFEQLCDMVRSAGGFVVLMGAGVVVALVQLRKLRERFRRAARQRARGTTIQRPESAPLVLTSLPFQPAHAPPVPLRI